MKGFAIIIFYFGPTGVLIVRAAQLDLWRAATVQVINGKYCMFTRMGCMYEKILKQNAPCHGCQVAA